jgi:hypothetical protein
LFALQQVEDFDRQVGKDHFRIHVSGDVVVRITNDSQQILRIEIIDEA